MKKNFVATDHQSVWKGIHHYGFSCNTTLHKKAESDINTDLKTGLEKTFILVYS